MATCNHCKKSPPEVTLKKCAKCLEALYCSRDCQKADWKSHKVVCVKHENATSGHVVLSPPKGLDAPIADAFTHLGNGTWLHGRSQKDVYRLLIDVYCLRLEDNYVFTGDIPTNSFYGGTADGTPGFRRFLSRIEKKNRSLLPDWWSDEEKAQCIAFGRRRGTKEWSCLAHAVEKSDIDEHYGDRFFAVELRIFADIVYDLDMTRLGFKLLTDLL
ncbi:hypothetical protein BR93DRAFT_999029 [Coniochaeta sp. PMI_546]|nr:hypothetical protein BR93DRAFT_999029 [Coniochaeta sp. PMI_546]